MVLTQKGAKISAPKIDRYYYLTGEEYLLNKEES